MTSNKPGIRISAESLVPEIRETLFQSRLLHQEQGEKHDRPFSISERIDHERTVMLDVTIALLIRHRVPIDADAAAIAVRRAQERAAKNPNEMEAWANGCAEHIVSMSQGAKS